MTRFERENLKGRLLRLAALESTGTPDDVASRFGISPRSVKRIAKEAREDGYDIRFSKQIGTYILR
jgi:transposase